MKTQLNNVAVVTHGNLLSLIIKKFDVNFGFEEWARLTNPDLYILESNLLGQQVIKRIWK